MGKDKELLFTIDKRQLRIETFYSGGPGGQNQNKRSTGARITHLPSGAVGECREERSLFQNKRKALHKLTQTGKFRLWLTKVLFELKMGKTIDELVDEQLKDEFIRVEVKDKDGRWVKWEGSQE